MLDLTGQFVVPHRVEKCDQDIQTVLGRFSQAQPWLRSPFQIRCALIRRRRLIRRGSINWRWRALERYRLARSRYPDSQEELVPEFIRVLPRDIINGQPLHYSRIPDRGYQIYSVGWDEQDDGLPCGNGAWGNGIARGNGIASLDWVWRFPLN